MLIFGLIIAITYLIVFGYCTIYLYNQNIKLITKIAQLKLDNDKLRVNNQKAINNIVGIKK